VAEGGLITMETGGRAIKTSISSALFDEAKKIIPGGVNSPVRAFGPAGINPPFIKKALGSKIIDEDGNTYIDYVGSWGPMILGHAHPEVIKAVKDAAEDGTSFGAPTRMEIELARLICEAVPSVDMVRMVNSGTEAVMSAVRLARGYTGRDMVLKLEGCYHGHSDGLLVKAGSGALTAGVPDSAGVPMDYAKNTLTAPYNNFEGLEEIFKKFGDKLAAAIIEPVAGNMGVIPPKPGFLELLRQLTEKHGTLLIFDEVITGFRVGYSGAQGLYGIQPDITVFGKIIGGGMPVGAYGGRKDIMKLVSPTGPVYQAGTLSGNPVAMAAGIKTLEILKNNPSVYEELDEKAAMLEKAFKNSAARYGMAVRVNRVGSILTPFFTNEDVTDYKSAVSSDTEKFKKYFKAMISQGIYIAPSQYEAVFVSAAHSDKDIERTVTAIDNALSQLQEDEK